MTQRELERLEKDSVYSLRVNSNLKDKVINGYLTDLNRMVKKEVKKGEVTVFVIKKN